MSDSEEYVLYSGRVPFKHAIATQGFFMLFLVILISLMTFFVALPVWLFVTWLGTKHRRVHITTQRIEVTKGFLSRQHESVEFYRANDSAYKSGLWQSMLGIGTVSIFSSDTTAPDISFPVADPADIREKIRNAILEERRRMGTVARD